MLKFKKSNKLKGKTKTGPRKLSRSLAFTPPKPAPAPAAFAPAIVTAKTESGKFKIQTVKWSWASKVQSKTVYRDDEFIESNSAEEALEAMEYLLNKPKGLTYAITVHRDGKFFTYYRHSMPCLGGLVKYRDSHGERYFMNPYFPRDIRVAFPEGDIVYIGNYAQGTGKAVKHPYYQFLLSQESPWISAFEDKESIIFGDNYLILTNMKTDPTVFYSIMRLGGLCGGLYGIPQYNQDPKAFILQHKTNQADPRRLAGQKPIRISGGTWADGYGYTRPYNESIFKTDIPTLFKDFGKLAGYPQAEYTNTYFIGEMKKVFGVDMARPSKDLNEVLVKSWDYFKEQAKKLTDYK